MTSSGARAFRPWMAAALCAAAGVALFHFFGNPTRGYINSPSVFTWWFSQWFDPAAETQHGPLILVISAGLLWWKLRMAECGLRIGDPATRRTSPPEQQMFAPTDSSKSKPSTQSTSSNPQSAIRSPQSVGPQSSAAAFVAMVAGLGIHALGYLVQQTRISIVGLLLFTWGVLRLGGGAGLGRAAAFPVAFLAFAIPVSFLETVGFHLRLAVIETTEVLAHFAGIDVVRNGTQLFAPDGRYQYDVAAACSGVRSLMALLALSLVIGYINLRSTLRRLAVFALAFPLTFLGNVVRIAAVVFAGEWFGQRAGEWVHDWAGFIVFVIVLGGVQLAANRLSRGERDSATCHVVSDIPLGRPTDECHVVRDMSESGVGRELARARVNPDVRLQAGDLPKPRGLRATRPPQVSVWGALAVLGVAASVAVFTTRVDAWLVPAGAGVRLDASGEPAQLPAFIATEWIGRAADVTPVEREVLPADTGYSRRTYTSTRDRRKQVLLSIVLSGRDRTSIHRPEMCVVGQGWTIERRMERTFPHPSGGAVPAVVLHLSREVTASNGERLRVPALLAYWFVGRDALATTTAERMWRTAINRLRLQPDRWAYVVAQTLVLPAESEAAALARIQEVLDGTLPEFQPVSGIEG